MTAAVAGAGAELAGGAAESGAATGASAGRAGAAASGSAAPARKSTPRKSAPRKGSGTGRHRKASSGADLVPAGRNLKKKLDQAPKANLKRSGRRLLVAEFITCAVVVAFSPLTDKHKQDSPVALMKRSSAVAALFFLLALVASGGRGASRVAAAFGGLVTLTLLVSERDIFTVLAQRFNADPNTGPAGPAAESIGGELGSAVGAVVAQGVP